MPLELETIFRRGLTRRWLQVSAHDPLRIGIQRVKEFCTACARLRFFEQPVIQPDFCFVCTFLADPVNRALDLVVVRAFRAGAAVREIRAMHRSDVAVFVFICAGAFHDKEGSGLGYCLRDEMGAIRGLNLSFPASFVAADERISGLCSGSFFVEAPARSMGFYLFRKYLGTPGYSFFFATTCNATSGELWKTLGGSAVPNSETEYFVPLRLDVMIPAFLAKRTSSAVSSGIGRLSGRCVNPILRLLTRTAAGLTIEPCQDWDKLAELSRRHRPKEHITSDRSAAFLRWRYGPASPVYPCNIYLFRDARGNEGWFSLGKLVRGEQGQIRASVLLDAIYPREKVSFRSIFREVLRLAVGESDAVFFRSQPGLDYREYSRWIIPRRLGSPRAFVMTRKGAPLPALDVLDYDDSDYVAWRFQWTAA